MAEESENSGGSSLKARATAKVGPLPVWGWVVVVGVAAYLYYKHKQSTAKTAAAPRGPVTVKTVGGGGRGEDTGEQEQLNDLNKQLAYGNDQLANIATNVGHEAKDVRQTRIVTTRKANLHDPADVQHYFLVHNTNTGKYYYVNPSEQTSFTLTDAAAKGNLKYKPKVYSTTKVPVFKQGKLVYV